MEQFASRFIEGHARANRQKPSGIAAKEMIVRVHLVPALGASALDAITNEDVQRLKHRLLNKAPKTVNNVLTVLSVMLKKAVEWDVIERLPCTVKVLPVSKGSIRFYDFDEFERLVAAARKPTHARRSSSCLRAKQGCGSARWWRLNGATSTSTSDTCVFNGRRGRDRSRQRKADGYDTYD